jgi:multidrug efflux pump subunit AcrB
MATSLAFGLAMATVLVLILIPVFYSVYARIIASIGVDAEEH